MIVRLVPIHCRCILISCRFELKKLFKEKVYPLSFKHFLLFTKNKGAVEGALSGGHLGGVPWRWATRESNCPHPGCTLERGGESAVRRPRVRLGGGDHVSLENSDLAAGREPPHVCP